MESKGATTRQTTTLIQEQSPIPRQKRDQTGRKRVVTGQLKLEKMSKCRDKRKCLLVIIGSKQRTHGGKGVKRLKRPRDTKKKSSRKLGGEKGRSLSGRDRMVQTRKSDSGGEESNKKGHRLLKAMLAKQEEKGEMARIQIEKNLRMHATVKHQWGKSGVTVA